MKAAVLTVLFLAPAAARADGEFMGTFTAYVGAKKSEKKCDKKNGGGNESASGPKPQDMATEDGTSSKGPVMLAVADDVYKKYHDCRVEVPGLGDQFFIKDVCPECTGMHFDVSFKNTDAGCATLKNFKHEIQGVKFHCPGGERGGPPAKRSN